MADATLSVVNGQALLQPFGAEALAQYVLTAVNAANDAAQSATYAGGFETPEYASQSAGNAATTQGQIFRVPVGTTPQTFNWYRRLSSGSELVSPLVSAVDLASTSAGKGIDLISRVPYPAASRTALKALDTTRYTAAHLLEAGRWGLFYWTTGDFTARVAADPREVVFIKATAVADSVGAWVRQYDELTPEMAGGVADGTFAGGGTDNTAAIQGIFNLLDYLSNRTVRFNGVYSVKTTTSRVTGSLTRTLECWSDDVILRGPGCIVGLNTTSGDSNWRFVLFGGAGKLAAGTGDIGAQRCIDKTGKAITGPIAEGGSVVPVAAGDEAAFAAGDVVFIRTGQLLSARVTEPKAELAVVRSTTSGQIILDRPTTHSYAQEYFISGTEGPSSTSVTANPARYEIVNVTDRVQRRLRIEDGLRFRYAAMPGTWSQCLSMWGILGVNLDCRLDEYPAAGMGWRDASDAVVNVRMRHNGVLNTTYGFHPSTGCTRFTGVVDQSSPGFNTVQFHEAVGDVRMVITSRNQGNAGEVYGGLNIANRARNIFLTASIYIGSSTQNAAQNIDGTEMVNVVIELTTNGNVRDDSGQILFMDRGIAGRRSMRGLQAATNTGSRSEIIVLTGVVAAGKTTCTLGTVPQDAFIVSAGASVFPAISGGSSTRINMGFVGGTGIEVINGAICNTTGAKFTFDSNNTASGGGAALGAQRGASGTLQASFVDPAATAGSVAVWAAYFVGARRD